MTLLGDVKRTFEYKATETAGSKNVVITICIILENVQIETT
jgi:hypothetical protein